MFSLCARSEVQELSFKDNNYHVYQPDVSRSIILEFSKIQGYAEVKTIVMLQYLDGN